MADDVDPNPFSATEPTAEAAVGPVEIAMMEIEVVELEPITAPPEADSGADESSEPAPPEADSDQPLAEPEVEAEGEIEPVEPVEPIEPLPTMADLDRVASDLDTIDARLASLDEQRP